MAIITEECPQCGRTAFLREVPQLRARMTMLRCSDCRLTLVLEALGSEDPATLPPKRLRKLIRKAYCQWKGDAEALWDQWSKEAKTLPKPGESKS